MRSKLLTNYSYLLPKQREFISGKDPESFLGLLLAKRLLFLTSFQRLHYIQSILAGFSSSPAYFLGIKCSLNFIFLFVVQKSSCSIQPMSLIKRSIPYIIIKISVFDFWIYSKFQMNGNNLKWEKKSFDLLACWILLWNANILSHWSPYVYHHKNFMSWNTVCWKLLWHTVL